MGHLTIVQENSRRAIETEMNSHSLHCELYLSHPAQCLKNGIHDRVAIQDALFLREPGLIYDWNKEGEVQSQTLSGAILKKMYEIS